MDSSLTTEHYNYIYRSVDLYYKIFSLQPSNWKAIDQLKDVVKVCTTLTGNSEKEEEYNTFIMSLREQVCLFFNCNCEVSIFW